MSVSGTDTHTRMLLWPQSRRRRGRQKGEGYDGACDGRVDRLCVSREATGEEEGDLA
jgi:hypothetical protein